MSNPTEEPAEQFLGVNDPTGRAITAPLKLSNDEVHVWLANLDDYAPDPLKVLLAEDELARAARFHFDRHRSHFIVARALLRKLLAAYLGLSPAELRFRYAEKGKPSLAEGQGGSLNFNLAHSHGLAIYGFTRNREIGVDAEFIRQDLKSDEVASRFFSRPEVEVLANLTEEQKKRAFFECWTRKEAYIKALGEGLSMPLNEFDVSLAPGEPAALLRNDRDPEEVRRWSMRGIAVPAGYVAAVVVEGQDWRLKTFAVGQDF